MAPDAGPLMAALLAEPSQAESLWRKWRAEIDLDTMSADCIRLLPVLLSRNTSWLSRDQARNIILGICKRAWTGNQLMLRSFVDVLGSLERAGVKQAAAGGPVAWALMHQRWNSFRPVDFLELVVPRDQALRAANELGRLGWRSAPGSATPKVELLDHVAGLWFCRQEGETLKLMWRLFPAPPELAAEWEALPPMEMFDVQGTPVRVPSKEAMLAYAIAGGRHWDRLEWRCDAIPLLRTSHINWSLVRKWIRFSPQARKMLRALAHETGLSVPGLAEYGPKRLRSKWDILWTHYCRHAGGSREVRSVTGFGRFLCERWRVPAWKLPVLGLSYLLRRSRIGTVP
jgi:Uncharacterised nucleotidyltransferase